MKKPGEQVFETNHSDGNILAVQKKITATANYIISFIVESEIDHLTVE